MVGGKKRDGIKSRFVTDDRSVTMAKVLATRADLSVAKNIFAETAGEG